MGLIYGPSGCGKSSLVKAGLLPRLADDVIAVYVEATAEETETRLLNGLRKRCPALPDNLGLKETLAALRRGQGIPGGQEGADRPRPVRAVAARQEGRSRTPNWCKPCGSATAGGCSASSWCGTTSGWRSTRFMRDLEVRLVEGQNSAAVDLFDPDHARKVLAAFGRAFGKLPENAGDSQQGAEAVPEQAVAGLGPGRQGHLRPAGPVCRDDEGQAVDAATLKEVGGTEGVGVTFLEETFSAATAPPEHRYHQKAARAVLKALLPESGTDIKGHMRSHAELLEASGYASRPKDFDDLLRILDSELRLITPTDPEGKDGGRGAPSRLQAGAEILPTDARLPGALAAGLADPQAEGDAAGPGRAAAGGTGAVVERPSPRTASCPRCGNGPTSGS